MLRLILFLFVGSTLAGIGVVAALSMGYYEVRPISVAAGIGAAAGVVISWVLGSRLQDA